MRQNGSEECVCANAKRSDRHRGLLKLTTDCVPESVQVFVSQILALFLAKHRVPYDEKYRDFRCDGHHRQE